MDNVVLTEDEKKVLGCFNEGETSLTKIARLALWGQDMFRLFDILGQLKDYGFLGQLSMWQFEITDAGRAALTAAADTAKTTHGDSDASVSETAMNQLSEKVEDLEEQLAAAIAERDELRARVDSNIYLAYHLLEGHLRKEFLGAYSTPDIAKKACWNHLLSNGDDKFDPELRLKFTDYVNEIYGDSQGVHYWIGIEDVDTMWVNPKTPYGSADFLERDADTGDIQF